MAGILIFIKKNYTDAFLSIYDGVARPQVIKS